MKKKKKSKKRSRSAATSPTVVDDWGPLFRASRDVIEWALDIASKLSRDYPEDVPAIERVREFAHAWLEGRRHEIAVNDVLTVIAILFAAIEIDTGIDSLSLMTPIKTFLDTPSVLPPTLRVSGAARDERPTVVIRRVPSRRNGCPYQLAA